MTTINLEIPNKKPINSRKKWEPEEENEILKMLSENHSIDEIAAKLERSKYSIKLRIDLLAVKAIQNGKDINDVIKLTNLNEEYINSCIIKCEMTEKRRKLNENLYEDIVTLKSTIEIMNKEFIELNEKLEFLNDEYIALKQEFNKSNKENLKKLKAHEEYLALFAKQIKLLQKDN